MGLHDVIAIAASHTGGSSGQKGTLRSGGDPASAQTERKPRQMLSNLDADKSDGSKEQRTQSEKNDLGPAVRAKTNVQAKNL